jgi:hypothetical protein
MHSLAVIKARNLLAEVRVAVEGLSRATANETFESFWAEFLQKSNRFFLKLEAGSKEDATTRQWYAAVKLERKKDELLNYLQQARHTDEHGIEPLLNREASKPFDKLEIGKGAFQIGDFRIVINGQTIFDMNQEECRPDGQYNISEFRLVPVTNGLHGDTFDAPKEHQGYAIPGITPLNAAHLALDYMSSTLEVAEYYEHRAKK